MKISTTLFLLVTLVVCSMTDSLYAQVEGVGRDCPVINENIALGSRGVNVENLQSFLIANDFNIPAITERNASKGFFGEETKAASVAYQLSVGLPGTGFVGPLTREKIKNSCGVVVERNPVFASSTLGHSVSNSSEKVVLVKGLKSDYTLVEGNGSRSNKAAFSFEFTISNNSQEAVHIGNKPNNSVQPDVLSGEGAVSMTHVTATPSVEEGDTNLSYIVPVGKTRTFIANGRIDNSKGAAGPHVLSISKIGYSTSSMLEKLESIDLSMNLEIDLEGVVSN